MPERSGCEILLTRYYELTAHHRQMCRYGAYEVIDAGVGGNVRRMSFGLAWDRDRQALHDEGMRVVFRIDESQPERVAFGNRYGTRHELVDLFPGDDAPQRKILLQERVGCSELFGEKWDGGYYDFAGVS